MQYLCWESPMDDEQLREQFDTGVKKIKQEIKSRLVPHGLFGIITSVDSGPAGHVPDGSRIEIVAKGKTVGRSFDPSKSKAVVSGWEAKFYQASSPWSMKWPRALPKLRKGIPGHLLS